MQVFLMAAAGWKKVKVVAIHDFVPSQTDDNILTQEQLNNAPDAKAQLSFYKGQCFEILTKNIKSWWLYVRCVASEREGFVPSTCVVPLKEDLEDETYVYTYNKIYVPICTP